ncbi:MAG: AIR synthase related protein [Promethearchaeota archaeon]
MLKQVADAIISNKNILEKKELDPVVNYIQAHSFKSSRIFSDIGEDAATILNKDKLILITTDRIRTDFIKNFPRGAGFSSILVSVDDIYACGGTPLAASVILSFTSKEKGQKIIEGICEGSKKFKVPIIRGHTKVNASHEELSTTMIGEIKKEHYISAGNAQINDAIILTMDVKGRVGKASKFYFDTTTFKDSSEVLSKRKAMNDIAMKKLAHASKDVSNGGIFGTILQLIKYSRVGADINITTLTIPPVLVEKNYDLIMFSQMYLTTAFILTAPLKNCPEIMNTCRKHDLKACVIGKVIDHPNLLRINDGNNSMDVLEF